MKIRTKITLWFSIMLTIITLITMVIIFYISWSVLEKNIQSELISVVEDNVDEIEFFNYIKDARPDGDGDDYIVYKDGFLEIDDDFLDVVNSNYTSLYYYDGTLIYGENPISAETVNMPFENSKVCTVKTSEGDFYVYDRRLEREGLEGLWLRGVVSAKSGTDSVTSVIRLSLFLLPALVIIAITGGYMIAGKILKPISQIAESASEISGGSDLKKRIDAGNGKDEINALGTAVNGMIGRLDKAFESEKRFASDVSHELRTPVSVITAQCEYTLESERSVDEYKQALSVINNHARKMNKMISQMLEFTRLETNTEMYKKTEVNFSELITLACMDFGYIRDKNISIGTDISENVFVFGNYELLQRMVNNLISNAYRYGRENGHVRVSLKVKNEFAEMSVEDDGIGIGKDDIDKIFNRFYRGDKSRSSEGTGLGLALVKEISEFHDGRIFVESEPDKGSKFIFKIKKI